MWVVVCVCLLWLATGPTPATAWVTVDSGSAVTIHGDLQVGPKRAVGKYDLRIMGDLKVGEVTAIDPFSPVKNADAEGYVSANRFIFRESTGLGNGDNTTLARDVMLLESVGSKDVSGAIQSHAVRLVRNVSTGVDAAGTSWTEEDVPFTLELVSAPVSEKGTVRVTYQADKTADVVIKSLDDVAARASLTLSGYDTATGDPVSAYTMRNQNKVLSFSATDYSDTARTSYDNFVVLDERMSLAAVNASLAVNLKTTWAADPRMRLHVSNTGDSKLEIRGANTQSLSNDLFVSGQGRAELALYQGDSVATLVNEPLTNDLSGAAEDTLAFRKERTVSGARVAYTLLEMVKMETRIVPEDQSGVMRIGRPDTVNPTVTIDNVQQPNFYGAELNVGDLNILFYEGDDTQSLGRGTPHLATFHADDTGSNVVKLPGTEINVHGYDRTAAASYADHALFLSSRRLIKMTSPSIYVGEGQIGTAPTQGAVTGGASAETYNGSWTQGAIQLNGTGMAQTAQDFPLMLHTRQTDANLTNGGEAGVKVMGTYKLTVGGITLRDTNDGRTPDDTNSDRSARRISSTGSLRLSTFDSDTTYGFIPDFGAGLGLNDISEVYVDGNEKKGQARLRVGTAVLHDAWTDSSGQTPFTTTSYDGIHVTSETNLDAAFMLAVGGKRDVGGTPTEFRVPGAPSSTDLSDPARSDFQHSGLMVLRSGLEVRVDEAAQFRVGLPQASVLVHGHTQSISTDKSNRPLRLDAVTGVEIGGRTLEEDRGD